LISFFLSVSTGAGFFGSSVFFEDVFEMSSKSVFLAGAYFGVTDCL